MMAMKETATCTEVDECSLGTHDCDPDATCTNVPPGSYTCTCNDGYEGDGKMCTEVDECSLGTYDCDPVATCTNTPPGSYTCTCNDGYEGDGKTCTEVDECSSVLCGDNAACVEGTCRCFAGYVGDPGFKCYKCFQDKSELEGAVDAYLNDSKPSTTVASTYGHPIGTWCVSDIEDFSHLFDRRRNEKTETFNEDLDGWDMSNAKHTPYMFREALAFNGDVTGWQKGNLVVGKLMFRDAKGFNRDISGWNISKLTVAENMFDGAENFKQNLCPWGPPMAATNMVTDVSVANMFRDTDCPTEANPLLFMHIPPGPFCFSCSVS
jgi:hypothetical protein